MVPLGRVPGRVALLSFYLPEVWIMCNASWKTHVRRHSKGGENQAHSKERAVKKIVWRNHSLLRFVRKGCFLRQELLNKGELARTMPEAIT